MPATQINIDAAKEDFAIIVGINDYPTLAEDNKPDNLRGPVPDAFDMTRFLVDSVGVPCANVICLTSGGKGSCTATTGNFDEPYLPAKPRPTDADIEAAVQVFSKRASAITQGPKRLGRRLWMYFAGHGVVPSVSTSDIVLLSADAQSTMILNHFTVTAWADFLALLPLFDEIVVWMDCCANIGYAFSPVLPPMINRKYRQMPAKTFYVTAAGLGQKAYEFQDREGKTRGIFTMRLIDGLRSEASADSDGWVTTETLRKFMKNDDLRRYMPPTLPNGAILERQQPSFPQLADLRLFHRPTQKQARHIPTAFGPGESVTLSDARSQMIEQLQAGPDGSVTINLGTGFFKLAGASGKIYFFETPGRLFGEVQGHS